MYKLRFAVALPILQTLVALILLLWADRTPTPRNVEFFYHPAAWLICKGLNAPAMLLLIPLGGTWYFVPPIDKRHPGQKIVQRPVTIGIEVSFFQCHPNDGGRSPFHPKKRPLPSVCVRDLLR